MSGIGSALAKVDKLIGRIEWSVATACLVIIVISTGLGVLFRYALNDPLMWANDVGIVSLTWMTFTGGSALFKERGHIAVEALDQTFPPRFKALLAVVLTILMGAGIAIIGWQMLTLIPLQNTKVIEALDIPRSAYGIPLGWATFSIAFSSIRQLLDGSLLSVRPDAATEA